MMKNSNNAEDPFSGAEYIEKSFYTDNDIRSDFSRLEICCEFFAFIRGVCSIS